MEQTDHTGSEFSEAAIDLRASIADRSARVGVLGLGYVGLPTALAFVRAGFDVVGIEINDERCRAVNAGTSYVDDVADNEIAEAVTSGMLRATTSLDDAGAVDIVNICVPTPLDKSRDPDVSALLAALEGIRTGIRRGQLVLLTSTSYPGTTVELLQPAVEATGLRVGIDVFIAFSPERIDPGNSTFGMRNTPRVVGGVTDACTEIARELLGAIIDEVVVVSSPGAAEMTKLLENTFRSVNIALANEVAIMCRHLGLDVWEVIDAAATKPYGFMAFSPGPGLGGHCIPVDPSYLSWKLRSLNYVARFIALADDINRHMPEHVVTRAAQILNQKSKSVRGSEVLVAGVSYKAEISDLRESPALDIIRLLRDQGAEVIYSDPYVPGPIFVTGEPLLSVSLSPALVRRQDLVVVATAHRALDWETLIGNASAVLDTRGWARDKGLPGWETL